MTFQESIPLITLFIVIWLAYEKSSTQKSLETTKHNRDKSEKLLDDLAILFGTSFQLIANAVVMHKVLKTMSDDDQGKQYKKFSEIRFKYSAASERVLLRLNSEIKSEKELKISLQALNSLHNKIIDLARGRSGPSVDQEAEARSAVFEKGQVVLNELNKQI